jgi:peptidylprolyl isomerase domain and WD repeat-containing protein 1
MATPPPDTDVDPSNKRTREDPLPEEEPAKKPRKPFYHPDLPTSAHYHVSWMHAATVTSVAVSIKHGYILTGSADGIVKFWKRLCIFDQQDDSSSSHPCLEFVKSFTAHTEAVLALSMDSEGDVCVSVGADGWLKFYEISTFDVSTMIHIRGKQLSHVCCWLQDPVSFVKAVAVASADSGEIFVCDANQVLQTITLHGVNVVTCLVAIPGRSCVLSADVKGIVEVWSVASTVGGGGQGTNSNSQTYQQQLDQNSLEDAATTTSFSSSFCIAGPCNQSRNGVEYTSKMDTDLYELVRKKTYCLSATATSNHVAMYCADQKLRLLEYATGKLVVTFDERLQVYDKTFVQLGLDAMEYGRRAALDREIMQEHILVHKSPQHVSIQFDPSGKYLLIPTLMGIKILDWERRKLMGWIGKAESQCRFLSVCLAHGDAKINQQLQLARKASTKTSAGAEADALENLQKSDALVVALAYDTRRFYVFSHLDLVEDPEAPEDVLERRDIWNEAPSMEDRLYNTDARGQSENAKTANKAILSTTMGDIHIQLFAQQVPKTIENFVGHSRSGYYDNVIFHRVIKGFMLQTGDPLGDGTGGESIWGGEFEDEFVPALRHDRPFTVSMANAGPNTNGSQFFITTVPTNWLDNKHTVFGRVVQGMDVCTLIENIKTDDLDKPLDEIRILNVDLE